MGGGSGVGDRVGDGVTVRVAVELGVGVQVALAVGVDVAGGVTTTFTTSCAATPCVSYAVSANWNVPGAAALNCVLLAVRLDKLTGVPAVCSQ